MLSNVGLQNRIKVLELSVGYKPNNEHLSNNKDIVIKKRKLNAPGKPNLINQSPPKLPVLLNISKQIGKLSEVAFGQKAIFFQFSALQII